MIDYSDRLVLAAALKAAGIEHRPDVLADVPEIIADPLDRVDLHARLSLTPTPDIVAMIG